MIGIVHLLLSSVLLLSSIAASDFREETYHPSYDYNEHFEEKESSSHTGYYDGETEEVPQRIRIPRPSIHSPGGSLDVVTPTSRQYIYRPVETHKAIKMMINQWPEYDFDLGSPDINWTNEFSDGAMKRICLNFALQSPSRKNLEAFTRFILYRYGNRLIASCLLSSKVYLHRKVVDHLLKLEDS